jgi:hypothetical protein
MGCDGESPSSRRHSRRTEALPSLLTTGMVQLTTAASNRPAVGFSAASSAHRQRNLSLCTRQCDSEAPHDGSGPLRRAPAPVPVCARAEKPGARLVSGAASVEVSECALMLRLGRATGYGAPKCHSRRWPSWLFSTMTAIGTPARWATPCLVVFAACWRNKQRPIYPPGRP